MPREGLASRVPPQPPPSPTLTQVPAAKVHEARQDGLDVMRALAILAVLLFHAPEAVARALPESLRYAFKFGWMGVDLFFVLSGYLIGRQVFATPGDEPLGTQLRSFWVKRWTRTLPLYFVVLCTYAFIKPWVFGAPFVGGSWRYALFLQNYGPMVDFVQSWSLCVEEHFYLVLPLLAFGLRGQKWPAWVWLLPMAVSVAARALVSQGISGDTPQHEVSYLYWATHRHLDGLGIGVFLARTAPHWQGWPARAKALCVAAGGGLLALTMALGGPLPVGHVTTWLFAGLGVSFGLVLVGLESLKLPSWAQRGVYAVAVTSYGAYLWHGLVERTFSRSHFTLGWWGWDLLAFLGVTLLVSWGTYVGVEKPGLRLRRWLLGSPRSSAVTQ